MTRSPGLLVIQDQYRVLLADAKRELGSTVTGYAEFGVFSGDSLVCATQEFQGADFWAFDSFQGLPSDASHDHGEWYEGEYLCPLPVTVRNMRRQGVDPLDQDTSITFVEGWFGQTLTPQLAQKIRATGPLQVVLIDCDIYSAAVQVLGFITPLLDSTAVLVYDDWFSYNTGEAVVGIKAAHVEWLADNPQLIAAELRCYEPTGKAFVISRGSEHEKLGHVKQ